MENTCATCNERFCTVHNQGSGPDPAILFLTGGDLSTSQHGVERLDPGSNNFSGECASFIFFGFPFSPPPAGYLDLSENGNQAAPSLHSASIEVLCPGAIEPYATAPSPLPPSPQKIYVPLAKRHVSDAVREAANRRRRRPLSHFCTDCDASFSSWDNLRCLYIFNHYRIFRLTLKHVDHYDSKHKGELNFPCKYHQLGCKFRAAAPRTATRHSRVCKYNPTKNEW